MKNITLFSKIQAVSAHESEQVSSSQLSIQTLAQKRGHSAQKQLLLLSSEAATLTQLRSGDLRTYYVATKKTNSFVRILGESSAPLGSFWYSLTFSH